MKLANTLLLFGLFTACTAAKVQQTANDEMVCPVGMNICDCYPTRFECLNKSDERSIVINGQASVNLAALKFSKDKEPSPIPEFQEMRIYDRVVTMGIMEKSGVSPTAPATSISFSDADQFCKKWIGGYKGSIPNVYEFDAALAKGLVWGNKNAPQEMLRIPNEEEIAALLPEQATEAKGFINQTGDKNIIFDWSSGRYFLSSQSHTQSTLTFRCME